MDLDEQRNVVLLRVGPAVLFAMTLALNNIVDMDSPRKPWTLKYTMVEVVYGSLFLIISYWWGAESL